MKIIITGGGGFLGRYIARQFKILGHNVSVLGRNDYPFLKKEGIQTIKADICNSNEIIFALKGFDEVHHAAAYTGLIQNKKIFYETNVVGTKNIINACLQNNIKRLIYASSASVVYNGGNQISANESIYYPTKYINYYSETKAIAEKHIIEANNFKNLITLSLRHHLLWGPEDTNLLPRLIERSLKNRLFIIGNGNNYADCTYVENAAHAHILASQKLDEKIGGNALFITNNDPVNLWTFINKILLRLDLKCAKKHIPFKVAYNMGFFLEKTYEAFNPYKEPIITRFLASQLHFSHTYSIKKAKEFLNYIPQISVDEGLERLIAYYKNKNLLEY